MNISPLINNSHLCYHSEGRHRCGLCHCSRNKCSHRGGARGAEPVGGNHWEAHGHRFCHRKGVPARPRSEPGLVRGVSLQHQYQTEHQYHASRTLRRVLAPPGSLLLHTAPANGCRGSRHAAHTLPGVTMCSASPPLGVRVRPPMLGTRVTLD